MEHLKLEEPWKMTREEFINYHKTGAIPEESYEEYQKVENLEWLGTKKEYPILYSKKKFKDIKIEFRKSDRKIEYIKLDEQGEVVRDKQGSVILLTENEVKQKNLPLKSLSIVAFHKDSPIGWVSDEFGTTGVWIAMPYQRKGIGLYLLSEFQKNFPTRKIGQMTYAGEKMVKAYHKQLIRQALSEGKHVPDKVLRDYPDIELDKLIDTIVKKGELLYTGKEFGMGKIGDVNLNFVVRGAVTDLGFLLENYPQLANRVPKEIQLLIKGKAYEGIFEDLRKSVQKKQEHLR